MANLKRLILILFILAGSTWGVEASTTGNSCQSSAECGACAKCQEQVCVRDEFCVQPPTAVVDSDTDVNTVTNRFAQVATTGVLMVAGVAVMMSGFLYVLARGDEQKLNRAKKAFWWALGGVGVALTAKLIVGLIYAVVG